MKIPLTFLLACCLFANSAFATLTGEVVYCDAVNGVDETGAVGDSSKPCQSVYQAIILAMNAANSAPANAPKPVITVIVRPGTYSITNNPQYITQQINIRGEPGAILIDSAASGAALLAFSQNSAGSTVEGLTFNGGFTGSSSPTANQGLVDVVGTNHISVRNCVFCTGKDSGVRIFDSQDCLVDHCQISAVSTGIEVQGNSDRVQLSNNSIQNGNNPTAGIGIDFHPDGNLSATQATVTDNQIGSGFQMGIQVYGQEDRVLVGHNAITGTGWGISFDHPNDSLIDGNTIYATTVIGIELADGCQHVTASNNIVHAQSGPAYTITTPNLGSNYISSVAINIIGGEASTNSSWVLQAYAQSDVHVSGGIWTAGSDGTSPFRFQGSGQNSIVGATINLNPNTYDVLDIQDDTAFPGTDFRDNLILGTPRGCVITYWGGGAVGTMGDSEISGNHLIGGPFPTGFSFVASQPGNVVTIKNNSPEDPSNHTGFPDSSPMSYFVNTSDDQTTNALVLENNGVDNGPGQGVGISFCPYSSGVELSAIRSVIQATSYRPTNLQFWTSNGATGGEHMVASFNYDLSATFSGTVIAPSITTPSLTATSMNTTTTTLAPVAPGTVATPTAGVTLYTSSTDGKLHAKDSGGNDHTLY